MAPAVPGAPTVDRRAVPALAAVVAALLAGGVLIVLESPVATASVVPVLVLLTVLAWRSPSAAALDAVLLTDLLYLVVAVRVLGLWPLPGAVAVALAWGLSRRSPRAPLWHDWLRPGTATREVTWLLLLIVAGTATALVTWQRVFDGRPPQAYIDAVAGRPLWQLVLAGAGFALANAAVEEAIFRGVLQTALQRVAGPAVAAGVQAVAFGVLHLVGVPTGAVGAVLAGTWGLLLGLLRSRTRGLLAPYVAHVAADVTIVLVLLPTVT